jgi:hypothetical protein
VNYLKEEFQKLRELKHNETDIVEEAEAIKVARIKKIF